MNLPSSPSNIVLIGMPGSGKSTVGVILAKLSARDFVDTDLMIQAEQGRALQDIVDQAGYLVLRQIEEKVLLGLDVRNHVIATGGSAVYSEKAMGHLRKDGTIVFLDADLATIRRRVPDFGSRGLAKPSDQSMEQLFEERRVLYRKYGEIIIPCSDLTHEEVAAAMMSRLKNRG